MTARALSLAFIALWIALGLYFMLQGVEMKLGTISSPGTGFMPFFVGFVVIVFGVLSATPLLISPPSTASERLSLERMRDPAIVVAAMIAYSAALERAGFIVSTALLIVLLARFVGRTSLVSAAALGVLATAFCYVVFGLFLGVHLP
ncbi:MAG: tripartite tricarboxylate transporter TctB family protein [Xanthobacteraceae bacterium]